jgi:hypothetical protein
MAAQTMAVNSNSSMQADANNAASPMETDLSMAPVVRFLQSALAMQAKGDSLHYHHLVAQLSTRDDAETLWRLYLGLARCVPVICER